MPPPNSCIGLIGTFDVENYGDVLLARITRRELESRLPATIVRLLAPVGYSGLNRFDDGSKRMSRIEYLLYVVILAVLLGPGVAAEFVKKLLGF